MVDLTQLSLAWLEGVGLAFSPCILPILPFIFSASAGTNKSRPLQIILGFVLSFMFFALISRQLLLATGISPDKIQTMAFVFMLLIGVIMLIPALDIQFAKWTTPLANSAQTYGKTRFLDRTGGAFLMGTLIGIIWTPCAGPILSIALLQVIQSKTNWQALGIMGAFSLGSAVPMLVAGYFSQTLSKYICKLTRHTGIIRQSMAILIIIFATLGVLGFNLGEWVTQYSGKDEPFLAQNRLINPLIAPYKTPEIVGIQQWINSKPLTMASLKGHVVLIDFWTYSCINCTRTLPYLERWYQTYHRDGLIIIGIHSPEFAFEQQPANVEAAVKKFHLTYPIALDNQLATWENFNNHYWPAHYLINKQGQVVYIHLGEGEYAATENNIRYLLNLDRQDTPISSVPITATQTPETYLGNDRAERESGSPELALHQWRLQGPWQRQPQYIQNEAIGASLALHYHAKKVFLVIENTQKQPGRLQVTQNGHTAEITVQEARLYQLIENNHSLDDMVIITALTPNLRLYAFTFES